MSEEKTENITKDAPKQGNPFLVPGAIVLAGLFIAFAIVVNKTDTTNNPAPEQKPLTATVMEVSENDHVRGAENPDVYLIEYSDYRCGYCGLFHDTVKQILEEYDGRVAWVYRHTPYQPGGREAAIASECIAEQLGEDAFLELY